MARRSGVDDEETPRGRLLRRGAASLSDAELLSILLHTNKGTAHGLLDLFGDIHIAEGVWNELNADGEPHPGSREVNSAAWVYRHAVKDQPLIRTLRRHLDSGEAETLALAITSGILS